MELATVFDMDKTPVSPLCIYTIVHSEKLRGAYMKGGKHKFTEGKNWARANKLLLDARKNDRQLRVLFASAEDCWELIYHAKLEAINIDKDGEKVSTSYQISDLTPFEIPLPKKTDLVLDRTGKRIAKGFIRPYAICKTPKYMRSDNK